MFGMKVRFEDLTHRVKRAAERATFERFNQAAYAIMQTAKGLIVRRKGPSPEGEPPHTHRRHFLKRSIRYSANKEGAVIGPVFSIVGDVGQAHELGGSYKGTVFPERPFMRPSLEENIDRFANGWSGSITE